MHEAAARERSAIGSRAREARAQVGQDVAREQRRRERLQRVRREHPGPFGEYAEQPHRALQSARAGGEEAERQRKRESSHGSARAGGGSRGGWEGVLAGLARGEGGSVEQSGRTTSQSVGIAAGGVDASPLSPFHPPAARQWLACNHADSIAAQQRINIGIPN